jgi:hypothetical protein
VHISLNYLTNYGYDNKWLSFIQNILNSCGMSNIWIDQNGVIVATVNFNGVDDQMYDISVIGIYRYD